MKSIFYLAYLKLKYRKQLSCKITKILFRSENKITILEKGSLKFNNSCFFNYGCHIFCMGKITIGENCIFGENVKIYDHNHIYNQKNKLIYQSGFKIKDIEIGNNCWIGSNVVILAGTKIGDNCVIGAGCVINGVIADNSIVKNSGNYIVEPIKYKLV